MITHIGDGKIEGEVGIALYAGDTIKARGFSPEFLSYAVLTNGGLAEEVRFRDPITEEQQFLWYKTCKML
jgi:hypothetical protein